MTYSQAVINYADNLRKKSPELREGQAIFLASFKLFPKTSIQLSGSNEDCFYNNTLIPQFLAKLEDLLKETLEEPRAQEILNEE